jgi:hypothetical protein
MHIEENLGSILRQEQQLLRYTHQRKDVYRGKSRVYPPAGAAALQVHPSEKRMHIEENSGSILRQEQIILRYTHQRKDAHRGKSRNIFQQ